MHQVLHLVREDCGSNEVNPTFTLKTEDYFALLDWTGGGQFVRVKDVLKITFLYVIPTIIHISMIKT